MFAGFVRRRAWIVLLAFVVGLAAAFVYTRSEEKQYESTAVLLFRQALLDVTVTGAPGFAPATDAAIASATNVGLITQPNVRAAAALRVGAGVTAEQIKDQVKVKPQKKSDLMGITARANSPQRAADIANAVAAAYLEVSKQQTAARIKAAANRVRRALAKQDVSAAQRRQLASAVIKLDVLAALGPLSAEPTQFAVPATKPSTPNLLLNLVVGAVVGLLLGLLLAVGVEYSDRRLHSPGQLEREAGVPLLGEVPESDALTAPYDGSWREDAEVFRQLLGRVRRRFEGDGSRTVLVVAPGPGSGASTVALHLALAAAEGLPTGAMLLEADVRSPVFGGLLSLPSEGGLSDLVDVGERAQIAVHPVSVARDDPRPLSVVVAGKKVENPSRVLASPSVHALMRVARDRRGLTVVDGLSPVHVADVLPLVPEVDGALIVARLGRDTGRDVKELTVELERQGVAVLGVVANFAPRGRNPYSG